METKIKTMIEANELRFGNLVNEEVLGDCKVSGISKETVWVKAKNIKSNGSHNLREFHINIECLKPIPLTEQWIEEWILTLPKNKLKFNIKREYVFEAIRFIINKYIILTIHNDGIASLGLLNQSFSIQLKYVHTFQNLYHALTNEELTLNK